MEPKRTKSGPKGRSGVIGIGIFCFLVFFLRFGRLRGRFGSLQGRFLFFFMDFVTPPTRYCYFRAFTASPETRKSTPGIPPEHGGKPQKHGVSTTPLKELIKGPPKLHLGTILAPSGYKAGSQSAFLVPPGPPGSTPGPPGSILEPPGSILEPPGSIFEPPGSILEPPGVVLGGSGVGFYLTLTMSLSQCHPKSDKRSAL